MQTAISHFNAKTLVLQYATASAANEPRDKVCGALRLLLHHRMEQQHQYHLPDSGQDREALRLIYESGILDLLGCFFCCWRTLSSARQSTMVIMNRSPITVHLSIFTSPAPSIHLPNANIRAPYPCTPFNFNPHSLLIVSSVLLSLSPTVSPTFRHHSLTRHLFTNLFSTPAPRLSLQGEVN